MKEESSRKQIRQLDRRARTILADEGGLPVSEAMEDQTTEDQMLSMLAGGGPALAPPENVEHLKSVYMAKGAALRRAAALPERASAPVVSRPRFRALPALARVALVAVLVIGLVVTLGFGTAYAKPGNPLYSVKRAVESAQLSAATSDEATADAYTSFTNRRLEDLEYVKKHGMADWYYSLANDIEGGIENINRYGKRLRVGAAEKETQRARRATLELEGLLPEVLEQMTPPQRGHVERGLQQLRLRLRMGRGGPTSQPGEPAQPAGGPQNQSGPGSQSGQPDSSTGAPQQGQQNQDTPQQGQQQGMPQQQQQQQQNMMSP